MPEIVYNVSKLLKYMSGNQGLSKKIIHYNKNNLNDNDDITFQIKAMN